MHKCFSTPAYEQLSLGEPINFYKTDGTGKFPVAELPLVVTYYSMWPIAGID